MQAVCVKPFRDLDAGVMREEGDIFEVSPQRLQRLNGTKYGQLAKEAPKPKRTRRAKQEEE